jgi:hypothetical protein
MAQYHLRAKLGRLLAHFDVRHFEGQQPWEGQHEPLTHRLCGRGERVAAFVNPPTRTKRQKSFFFFFCPQANISHVCDHFMEDNKVTVKFSSEFRATKVLLLEPPDADVLKLLQEPGTEFVRASTNFLVIISHLTSPQSSKSNHSTASFNDSLIYAAHNEIVICNCL